jgi:hypothetical protein
MFIKRRKMIVISPFLESWRREKSKREVLRVVFYVSSIDDDIVRIVGFS